MFVLFYAPETAQSTASLHSNFSAAAYALHEQRVNAKLGKMEVSKAHAGRLEYAQRLRITELPDIKIFRYGTAADYQAGAGTLDLVDVARWNAGNLGPPGTRLRSRFIHDVESPGSLKRVLSQHRFVLVAFTTRWCSRCLTLAAEFEAAAQLLATGAPPVKLAAVDIDNPHNRPLTERFGVLSFPLGKVFHRGQYVGEYAGGSLAHEIVTEMLMVRDELRRAEAATVAAGGQQAEVGKDEL
jgi:thiol-disulfide isomerase/thioredoxin